MKLNIQLLHYLACVDLWFKNALHILKCTEFYSTQNIKEPKEKCENERKFITLSEFDYKTRKENDLAQTQHGHGFSSLGRIKHLGGEPHLWVSPVPVTKHPS